MQRRTFNGGMLAGLATTLAAPLAAAAEDYPARPISILVPAPAGGALDMIARALAEEMAATLKQPVLVDNRPGAAGVIATSAVVKAPPDGYTLTLTLTQAVLNNLFLFSKVPYDTRRDLAFISEICTGQLVMVADARLPVNNVKELLAWAASHPGKATYGSWGPASLAHVYGFHLSRSRGVEMVHVPYKGEAPMLQDIMGGQVSWAMASIGSTRQHIESGRLKALAVTGDARADGLSTVPTLAEAGIKDPELAVTGSVLLMAPAATPPAVLARLEKESLAALATPRVRARMQVAGFVPLGHGAKEARANYDAIYPVQEKLFKSLGIRLD